MINSLGGVRQLGMVVKDIDATMRHMAELGIGPFFVFRNTQPEDYRYRGKPAPAPIMTVAIAQSGPLQIELIQQHNDAPSGYLEFLAAGREGCQHFGVWFADRDAYTKACEQVINSGLTLVHENGAGATVRFAYFATDIPGGPLLELSEPLLPEVRGFADMVAAAAENWDGTNPIRDMG